MTGPRDRCVGTGRIQGADLDEVPDSCDAAGPDQGTGEFYVGPAKACAIPAGLVQYPDKIYHCVGSLKDCPESLRRVDIRMDDADRRHDAQVPAALRVPGWDSNAVAGIRQSCHQSGPDEAAAADNAAVHSADLQQQIPVAPADAENQQALLPCRLL